MDTEKFSFEEMLEIFVSGGIVVIGSWYLHRAFLSVYFPSIFPYSLTEEPKVGGKTIVLTVLVLLSGIVITHVFDAIIPLIFRNERISNLGKINPKKILYHMFRLVTFAKPEDPRVRAINRYLESSRKSWFMEVAKSWAGSSEEAISSRNEKIAVHQHLVNRLKIHSKESSDALMKAYNDVSFSGAIFIAFCLLIPISLLSHYTQAVVSGKALAAGITLHKDSQILWMTFAAWGMSIVSAYSLKRRAKNFYSQVVTLAMHAHAESRKRTA